MTPRIRSRRLAGGNRSLDRGDCRLRLGAVAQTGPVVRIAGGSTEGLCEAYYAEELGLFKSYGLNAEVRVLASAAPMASAVASGDLHIGTNNVLSIGQAYARNIPFVIIASAERTRQALSEQPGGRRQAVVDHVTEGSGRQIRRRLNAQRARGTFRAGADRSKRRRSVDREVRRDERALGARSDRRGPHRCRRAGRTRSLRQPGPHALDRQRRRRDRPAHRADGVVLHAAVARGEQGCRAPLRRRRSTLPEPGRRRTPRKPRSC